MSEPTIEVYEVEDRTFPPSEEFKATALTCDSELYDEANADFEVAGDDDARRVTIDDHPDSQRSVSQSPRREARVC